MNINVKNGSKIQYRIVSTSPKKDPTSKWMPSSEENAKIYLKEREIYLQTNNLRTNN